MSRRGLLAQRLATCKLAPHLKPGLRALGNHSGVILEKSRSHASDSLSFDEVVRDSPTFDYLVGMPAAVIALEVHPAQASQVKRLVEKKKRTKAFLSDCRCICVVERWCWAPTKGVHLPTITRARAILNQAGIEWPVGQLDLRTSL